MNTYILKMLNIETSTENEVTSYKTTEINQAFFFNLSDAIYFAQNDVVKLTTETEVNYVMILAVPTGTMDIQNSVREFYVLKYAPETNSFNELGSENEVYKYLASENNVPENKIELSLNKEKTRIKLDLSKEEIIPTKEFVGELKQNLENKNYGRVKEMIEQKEEVVSNKINGFLNEVSDSLKNVDNAVNQLFDILNGKF